jgi:hypothetical protein
MAKRAPILPENYNPVGERLRSFSQPLTLTRPSSESFDITPTDSETPVLLEREPIPEIPTEKELKAVSVRFRCTPSERKKWHEITRELSGDHNNLSHFIRAAMLLLENSHEQLMKLAPEIQRFKKPGTTDMLGITLYEQRLSQYLYDAIRLAGRPRG